MVCKHTGTKQGILQAKDWDIACIIPFYPDCCSGSHTCCPFSNLGRDYIKAGPVMTGFPSLLQRELP